MRIRLVPLGLAAVATSVAVAAAVALGAWFMPMLTQVARGRRAAMIGAGVAVIAGVVTAVVLALHRTDDKRDESPER